MKEPIRIDDCVIDRSEIAAILRQEGRVIVFLKSGKTINMPDTLTSEELDEIAGMATEE